MKSEAFYEALKCTLGKLKEETLCPLVARDNKYQKLSNQLELAKKAYQLLELTPEQQNIIECYILLMDSYNMECSTLNYLAGLVDAQKIGMLIPSVDTTNTAESIHKFYYDIFQPCAVQCETTDTIEFLKDLSKNENGFASTLSPDQFAAFEILIAKTQEGVGYSMADSFVYGFQLGTKILMTLLN